MNETNFHLVSRLKMRGAMPLLPQYVFMVWYLAMQRDKFKFILPFTIFSCLQRNYISYLLHTLLFSEQPIIILIFSSLLFV